MAAEPSNRWNLWNLRFYSFWISMSIRFSLGIDLGTSNSAIAVDDFSGGRNAIIGIPQILGINQIGEKPTLPSALYIPHPDEFDRNSMRLPWSKNADEPI